MRDLISSATSPMTPQQYGVGARFTLSVYDTDYVHIILDALAGADTTGLTVETNDISTFVSGDEQRILAYVCDVVAAAARSGVHVSASVLLSRGCPGELQCALPPGVTAIGHCPVSLEPVGIRARAHWSLYPLLDAQVPISADDATPREHMQPIYAAIEHAKSEGLYAGSDHYATCLDGDLAAVIATVANAWIEVGATVQHVVTHVTISLNSPTLRKQ